MTIKVGLVTLVPWTTPLCTNYDQMPYILIKSVSNIVAIDGTLSYQLMLAFFVLFNCIEWTKELYPLNTGFLIVKEILLNIFFLSF